MRCSRASKSSPLPSASGITISPSMTARSGRASASTGKQLGEVARERPLAAAGQLDVVAVAGDDAAEPVPLRLVQPAVAVGDRPRQLGQHRLDRQLDRESHRAILSGNHAASRNVYLSSSSDRPSRSDHGDSSDVDDWSGGIVSTARRRSRWSLDVSRACRLAGDGAADVRAGLAARRSARARSRSAPRERCASTRTLPS